MVARRTAARLHRGKRLDFQIYVLSASGGAPRPLVRSVPASVLPTWSSRGQIVFTSARTERANLYSVEADGSRLRVLVRNAADSFPAWSPDGTRIAFERPKSRCFGREIVVMRIDGSGLRVVTEGVFDAASHAWSPDGRTIAYGSEGSIYLVNADGSRKRFVDLRGRPAWRPVP